MRTGVQYLRGGGRRRLKSFFQKLSGTERSFCERPKGFVKEGTPAIAFLDDLPFLSRHGDPRTACSEGGHTPQHPGSVSPSRRSSGGGERPQPRLCGARVLKGRLRAQRLDHSPTPPPTLPVEWGESLGRIVLPLARTEFSRSLHFHNVLISPVHPRARRSTSS